jgi:hypothetical protein
MGATIIEISFRKADGEIRNGYAEHDAKNQAGQDLHE